MRYPRRPSSQTQIILTCAVLLATAGHAAAQANFSESFQGVGDGSGGPGGPSVLAARGWIFRNQSRPAGTGASPYWYELGNGWGQSGSCLGHGGFVTWQNSSTRISAWIILPAIANQITGDPLTFWESAPTGAFGNNGASLEVRYSPTGAIGTGSNDTDVGSFTQVLSTISGAGGHTWTQRTMSLPGTGRIALRLVVPSATSSFDFAGQFLLDSLQVGSPPPLPYPMPTAAGQTVHWTNAMSPVQLRIAGTGQSPRIIPGGTVIVDPGVEVRVGTGVVFDVSGTLSIQGTAALPVRLRGATGYPAGWARVSVAKGGLISASFADVETFTDLIYGGKASFTDSVFRDPAIPTDFSYDAAGDIGHRSFDGNLDYARQILSLTRCTFGQGCEVALLRGWLAARDCTFTRGGKVTNDPGAIGGEAMYITGGAILKNVTVSEAFIDLTLNHDQHRFIGNTTVTGNPYGAGIRLEGGGSYLIDPTVTLQNNVWPVSIGGNSAGILPGSVLPATGNLFNEIPDTTDPAPADESVVWADAGIPYILSDNGIVHGQLSVLPGVTIKARPDIAFQFSSDSNGLSQPALLGEPERPIRLVAYTPGTKWRGIGVGSARYLGTRWDWCVVEDARLGISSVELPIALDNCIIRRSIRATGGDALFALRKCTIENNVFSYSAEFFAPAYDIGGFLDANHPANPNTFLNNRGNPGPGYVGTALPNGGMIARARHNSIENTDSDVRNNWWGTPSGPHHPTRNPAGTGDELRFGIDAGGFFSPFLAQAPSADPPPVVRFVGGPLNLDPGEPVIIHWTARDNGSITTQRIYYSPNTNLDSGMQLLAEIPAAARSFEWTPPYIGTPNGANQFFRVVAVDNLGQEGIADLVANITNPTPFTGSIVPTSPVAGSYHPGDSVLVCATVTPIVGSMYASVVLDNDDTASSLGSVNIVGASACTTLPAQLPDVSTDRARIRYDATGALNQVRSFYGPYFSIRPDSLMGDAAPVIALTSTHTGQSYPGGTMIPITWTASDDEALRSFDVRASYNGGQNWFIVARDLPGDARAYHWQLPASAGISSVKLRIVAKDKRFQNTSAESGAFAITPGVTCNLADIAGGGPDGRAPDGVVDGSDFIAFVNSFSTGDPAIDALADVAGGGAGGLSPDGIIDGSDFIAFINAFAAGC